MHKKIHLRKTLYWSNTVIFLITRISILALAGCNIHQSNSDSKLNQQKPSFINIVSIEEYGDSLTIKTTRHGDTLYKQYIDKKAKDNTCFDNSFTAICTYKCHPNDTSIKSDFFIPFKNYKFYFDTSKVIAYCDSVIALNSANTTELERIKSIKDMIYHKTPKNKFALLVPGNEWVLLSEFRSKIVEVKTGHMPQKVLIEFYNTEFSGGKNLFIINDKNDTLQIGHCMDYIK